MMFITVNLTGLNDRGLKAIQSIKDEKPSREELKTAKITGFEMKYNKPGSLFISYKIPGSAEIKSLEEGIKNFSIEHLARYGAYPKDVEIIVDVK